MVGLEDRPPSITKTLSTVSILRLPPHHRHFSLREVSSKISPHRTLRIKISRSLSKRPLRPKHRLRIPTTILIRRFFLKTSHEIGLIHPLDSNSTLTLPAAQLGITVSPKTTNLKSKNTSSTLKLQKPMFFFSLNFKTG